MKIEVDQWGHRTIADALRICVNHMA